MAPGAPGTWHLAPRIVIIGGAACWVPKLPSMSARTSKAARFGCTGPVHRP